MGKWYRGRKMARFFYLFFGFSLAKHVKCDGFSGIPGSYCSARQPDCCPDRNDQCSVPIQGTECYCDDFCDRRKNGSIPDCCPDFFAHCRNESVETTTAASTSPPITIPSTRPELEPGCWHGPEFYTNGTKIRKNCNDCYCRETNKGEEVFEFVCDNTVCLIQDDLVEKVNANQDLFSWKAANYSFFSGLTLAEGYKYRLGTFKPAEDVARMHELRVDKNAILPDRFDARSRWPKLIREVRDQGNCAASWAFSTTALAADRIAIMTKGEKNFSLSAQHLISCNSKWQKGCHGGYVDRAWWYLRKKGVVAETCYPFTGEEGATSCHAKSSVPSETDRCPSGSTEKRLYETTPPYRIAAKEIEIRYEIYTNGPVQAVFHVSPDFFMYRSGVYRSSNLVDEIVPQTENMTGYHSVRIVGWGTDSSQEIPVNYWLCMNSWGTQWGEDGTFRILRGENEAEIESFVVGVWGKRRGDNEETPDLLKRRRRNLRRNRKRMKRLERKSRKALRSLLDLLN